MYPFNTAQLLLLNLGFDVAYLLAPTKGRLPSNTKRGPGRKHVQGAKIKRG